MLIFLLQDKAFPFVCPLLLICLGFASFVLWSWLHLPQITHKSYKAPGEALVNATVMEHH